MTSSSYKRLCSVLFRLYSSHNTTRLLVTGGANFVTAGSIRVSQQYKSVKQASMNQHHFLALISKEPQHVSETLYLF
jgi:hypothetical protein